MECPLTCNYPPMPMHGRALTKYPAYHTMDHGVEWSVVPSVAWSRGGQGGTYLPISQPLAQGEVFALSAVLQVTDAIVQLSGILHHACGRYVVCPPINTPRIWGIIVGPFSLHCLGKRFGSRDCPPPPPPHTQCSFVIYRTVEYSMVSLPPFRQSCVCVCVCVCLLQISIALHYKEQIKK